MLYKVLVFKFYPASRRGEAFVHFVNRLQKLKFKIAFLWIFTIFVLIFPFV
jgi:hypothetical protein